MDNPTHPNPQVDSLESEETLPAVDSPADPSAPLVYPERRASPGVVRDDNLASAGKKIILFHFAEMLANEEGTRQGDDIEALHDMRVATRRMRAAFDIFGEAYKPKAVRRLLKGLRKTGRALGAVRDMDVLMEHARKYASNLPKGERSGLDPLMEYWQTQREQQRTAMLSHLDGSGYERFKKQINRFVQTPEKGEQPPDQQAASPMQIKDIAPLLLYKRMGEVQAYESLLATATIDQLHALRIEFKKLRYAAEFLREPLGPEVKGVIQVLKQVQDHLGELNDARVAAGIITGYLGTWEEREGMLPVQNRHSAEPVASYLAYRYAERYRLMTTFGDTWKLFDSPDFRQALAASIAAL